MCFGISISDTIFDGVLQEANMIIVENEQCNQGFKGRVIMKESEMCARAERVGSGTCEVSKEKFWNTTDSKKTTTLKWCLMISKSEEVWNLVSMNITDKKPNLKKIFWHFLWLGPSTFKACCLYLRWRYGPNFFVKSWSQNYVANGNVWSLGSEISLFFIWEFTCIQWKQKALFVCLDWSSSWFMVHSYLSWLRRWGGTKMGLKMLMWV